MRNFFFITCFIFSFSVLKAQTPVGTWSDHLSYTTAKGVAAGSKEIFASTGSSLISYNRAYAELRKITKIEGLTETGISAIAWSEDYNTLVVAYLTTNVDLMKDNTIYNIPDISRKYIPGKKTINRIRINGKYAFLACSFGIVLIDLAKSEIHDTWKPGDTNGTAEVWDIAFGNDTVYAVTGRGVFYADMTNNGLAYYGNWSRISSLPSPYGKYTLGMFTGDRLYVNRTGDNFKCDTIYSIRTGYSVFSAIQSVFNKSFDKGDNGFTVSSPHMIRYYGSDGSLQKTISSYGLGSTNISQAIEDEGNIWIADISSGFIKGDNMTDFTVLSLPGPVSDNAVYINASGGKILICGGATDVTWNNAWRRLELSIETDNEWATITSSTLHDPLRAVTDPADNNHLFVSTWGAGLLEYEDNVLTNQYTEGNSPLQTIIAGKPYVRVCGLAMDRNGYLWITQTEVPGSIKILKPDHTWIVNPVTIDAPTIGDILIARNGYKWIVLPRGYGLFVLDDNNTPEYFDDDRYKKMLVTDSENRIISFVYCISEDLDGNIWVGTDQGPLIYYNPEKVLDTDLKAYRIKIPRNDGSGLADYMLGTESVTSIAVDGANRKWLGTLSSGSFLLSSDGKKQIKSFNESNSPLYSNSISSISIDEESGDVWFATSKGVISYRGDATAGADRFENVYSYPNPVREDYSGNVTIRGLMRDTRIRITNISGDLVYKTVSDGGEATWDLTTYNGRHVATGVYLVFCSSSDGSRSCVTKILVIR